MVTDNPILDMARGSLLAYSTALFPKFQSPPHIVKMALAYEAVEAGRIKRLMVFAPPRHGKTELGSKNFVSWYHGRNPGKYIIQLTYNKEFANDFGSAVKSNIEMGADIFPQLRLSDDTHSKSNYKTSVGGRYIATSKDGAVAGRGAHLLNIDDPIKNREEANSKAVREAWKTFYKSVAYQRLEPDGAIVLTMCMTGDTPVLMADGLYRSLKDVKKGDKIATYDNGMLSSSLVLNHKNNHSDFIFKIITTCGKVVRANKQHPFLTEDKGELKWIRLENLTTAHKIVTLKDNGANGQVNNAVLKGAKALPKQKGIVTRIITRLSGQVVTDLPQLMQYPGEIQDLKGITALDSLNTMQCSQHKTGNVLYATSHQKKTYERIGAANCALIIATILTKFERYCATIATLLLGILKQRKMQKQWPDTSDFTTTEIKSIEPDGIEDVFDVQVDRTENFIANGLVSHNTRWHEDDLAGWLLKEHADEGWTVISLPAWDENEQNALWPERFPLELLHKIRKLSLFEWNSLYMQRPSAPEGNLFKRDQWKRWKELPPTFDRMIQSWDATFKETKDGSYVVGQVWGVKQPNFYLVDQVRKRLGFTDTIREIILLSQKWPQAHTKLVEDKANGPAIIDALKEKVPGIQECAVEGGSKYARAQAVLPLIESGNVIIPDPNVVPWSEEFIDETANFKDGDCVNDQVDAMSQALRYLNEGAGGIRELQDYLAAMKTMTLGGYQ
jgi:predicted phage terminase large subunit-like protein